MLLYIGREGLMKLTPWFTSFTRTCPVPCGPLSHARTMRATQGPGYDPAKLCAQSSVTYEKNEDLALDITILILTGESDASTQHCINALLIWYIASKFSAFSACSFV